MGVAAVVVVAAAAAVVPSLRRPGIHPIGVGAVFCRPSHRRSSTLTLRTGTHPHRCPPMTTAPVAVAAPPNTPI